MCLSVKKFADSICRAGSLSLPHSLPLSLSFSHPLSLTLSLFLSPSLSPSLFLSLSLRKVKTTRSHKYQDRSQKRKHNNVSNPGCSWLCSRGKSFNGSSRSRHTGQRRIHGGETPGRSPITQQRAVRNQGCSWLCLRGLSSRVASSRAYRPSPRQCTTPRPGGFCC